MCQKAPASSAGSGPLSWRDAGLSGSSRFATRSYRHIAPRSLSSLASDVGSVVYAKRQHRPACESTRRRASQPARTDARHARRRDGDSRDSGGAQGAWQRVLPRHASRAGRHQRHACSLRTRADLSLSGSPVSGGPPGPGRRCRGLRVCGGHDGSQPQVCQRLPTPASAVQAPSTGRHLPMAQLPMARRALRPDAALPRPESPRGRRDHPHQPRRRPTCPSQCEAPAPLVQPAARQRHADTTQTTQGATDRRVPDVDRLVRVAGVPPPET